MLVQKNELDGKTIIRVDESRIDASSAHEFKSQMRKMIDDGAKDLVLDLHSVDFIDSSGLGAIVGALKHLGSHGTMALSGLSQSVERVFKLTQMDKVFAIYGSVEDAVAAR